MNDVLLPIGSVFKAKEPGGSEESEDAIEYIIIGKRAINPNTMRAWDYIVVPLHEGFKNEYTKHREEWENNTVFFNHIDIEEIVKQTSCESD
ncbi:DUF4176 domain-containing protein [Bacillus subtilis]|uniref:DUF4176 domain-containing protein n=1 Tax=Bacillus subtilis TaxID=1423 RepID=UPI002D79E32F|nr:DUF4176 domain-containing protein [Bacillus subtilis]MEC0393101.1 DUF4176 domain-containing protein [Bacillus subtilis]MEC0398590.1 DUF4176 domain-containing protein [Bacillus subtilis]MEC0436863.1 DUF4176 domain-containing protein [Bacillus subtilis]WRU08048.1 DUF4176 domain-containing protein [Bacillus subtilis]